LTAVLFTANLFPGLLQQSTRQDALQKGVNSEHSPFDYFLSQASSGLVYSLLNWTWNVACHDLCNSIHLLLILWRNVRKCASCKVFQLLF